MGTRDTPAVIEAPVLGRLAGTEPLDPDRRTVPWTDCTVGAPRVTVVVLQTFLTVPFVHVETLRAVAVVGTCLRARAYGTVRTVCRVRQTE